MSLFHEIHSWNRENIENYVEVFLDVPLFELEERDPKGLYAKFKKGEIGSSISCNGVCLTAYNISKENFCIRS